MPFIESSETLRSKLHLSSASVPVVAGVLALAVVAVGLAAHNVLAFAGGEDLLISSGGQDVLVAEPGEPDAEAVGQDASGPASVYVYVSGSVERPGVYELAEGDRVTDAIEMAGGFAADAATDSLNLARVVQDGEQIDIMSHEEAEAAQTQPAASGAEGGASGSGGLVNLNTATLEQLQTLSGIGPSTAQKIIDSRESEGPFASKEDVMRVSGIGEKKYAGIEPDICI